MVGPLNIMIPPCKEREENKLEIQRHDLLNTMSVYNDRGIAYSIYLIIQLYVVLYILYGILCMESLKIFIYKVNSYNKHN